MLDHETCVHEVEVPLGQRVLQDVVLAHLEAWRLEGVQVAGGHVGREHLASRPDPLGEPLRDRAAAGPDLEAAPARLESDRLDRGPGAGIPEGLHPGEPLALLLPRLVVDIGHAAPRVAAILPRPLWQQRPVHRTNPLRVAIVGSGPAGFYAAGHLLKNKANPDLVVQVDMYDRLPTPWGLVRAGVAPDHPNIKAVSRVYEKTAAHPEFRFFGNVEFGADITHDDMLDRYHAVIYAVGAQTDKHMGIPGEDLPGSWAATEFVAWYNGHPDYRDLEFDLSCKTAVVIGNGNVAMDVTRMLAVPYDDLAKTDTTDHALEVLKESSVERVVVLGRRGPAQAAFTNPELLELRELTEADVHVDPARHGARRAQPAGDRGRGRADPPPQRGDPHRVLARPSRRAGRSGSTSASSSPRSRSGATARSRRSRSSATSSTATPTASCAPARPSSTRRSSAGSCSARSATAACRCRACRSTSRTP